MSTFKVAQLEDIDEITDGRVPWRPMRHHFGITSFGINAWTAPKRVTGSSTSTTRTARTRSSTSSTAVERRSSSTASAWTRRPARSSSPTPA